MAGWQRQLIEALTSSGPSAAETLPPAEPVMDPMDSTLGRAVLSGQDAARHAGYNRAAEAMGVPPLSPEDWAAMGKPVAP